MGRKGHCGLLWGLPTALVTREQREENKARPSPETPLGPLGPPSQRGHGSLEAGPGPGPLLGPMGGTAVHWAGPLWCPYHPQSPGQQTSTWNSNFHQKSIPGRILSLLCSLSNHYVTYLLSAYSKLLCILQGPDFNVPFSKLSPGEVADSRAYTQMQICLAPG